MPQVLHSSSNMDVNTLRPESQQFNLTVLVSFKIQCSGVKPKQWKEEKCVTVQILIDCTVYLRNTSANNKKNGLCCKWAIESLCSHRSCVLRGSLFLVTHVINDIQNSLLWKLAASLPSLLYQFVTSCTSNEKPHWVIDLHDIIHVCPHLYSVPTAIRHCCFSDKGIYDGGADIRGNYSVPPLPLHHPVSRSVFLPLSLSVFQWFDGCSWQMTISFLFRRGSPLSGG